MKRLLALLFSAVLVTGTIAPTTVSAADIRHPDESSGNVTIQSQETLKNLYTAGAIVSVQGNIEKSVHAAGGSVLINGTVGQDVHTVGGTVVIRGPVGGTVHVAGGEVIIEAAITDDLVVAGGNVYLSPNASVGGDLIVGAGNLVVESPIQGSIIIGAGEATINSQVSGIIKGQIERLTFGPNAVVAGNVEYSSYEAANILQGASILGEINYSKLQQRKSYGSNFAIPFGISAGFIFMVALFKVVAFIIAGLVLVYPLKKVSHPLLQAGTKDVWLHLGVGFASLITVPIAIFILMITGIGMALAFLLGSAYLLALVLTCLLTSILVGSWLIKIATKAKKYQFRWHEVLLGVFVMTIINFIPVIGWIASLVLISITLGTVVRTTANAVKS